MTLVVRAGAGHVKFQVLASKLGSLPTDRLVHLPNEPARTTSVVRSSWYHDGSLRQIHKDFRVVRDQPLWKGWIPSRLVCGPEDRGRERDVLRCKHASLVRFEVFESNAGALGDAHLWVFGDEGWDTGGFGDEFVEITEL